LGLLYYYDQQLRTFDLSSCQCRRDGWLRGPPFQFLLQSIPHLFATSCPQHLRPHGATQPATESLPVRMAKSLRGTAPIIVAVTFCPYPHGSCTTNRLSHIPCFARTSPVHGHHDTTTYFSQWSISEGLKGRRCSGRCIEPVCANFDGPWKLGSLVKNGNGLGA